MVVVRFFWFGFLVAFFFFFSFFFLGVVSFVFVFSCLFETVYHYVALAGLKFTEASASSVLGLKVYPARLLLFNTISQTLAMATQ